MAKQIVSGRGWDFDLSRSQKRLVAWFIGSLSFAAWALFSTPNTVEFVTRFTSGVAVFGWTGAGFWMGAIIAVILSIKELLSIYLAVWKSPYFWFATIMIGTISVLGSIKFENISTQNQHIKFKEVESIQSLVDQKQRSIAYEEKQLDNYEAQANALRSEGKNVPTWLFRRSRETLERKSGMERELAVLTDSLNTVRKRHGPIMAIGNVETGKSNFWTVILAIIVEIFLIGGTLISILVYVSDDPSNDEKIVYFNNQRYVLIDNDNGKSTSRVTPNRNQAEEAHTFGFNPVSADDTQPKVTPPDNSATGATRKPVSRDSSLGVVKNPVKKGATEIEIPMSVRLKLRKFFFEKGASDDTILYLYDNVLGRNIKRISIMTGDILNRNPINRNYVRRVLQRERGV